MQQAIFPERIFQVWSYTVGMRRLLLRSTKSEMLPTRVDVLFQNVRAIRTLTSLSGLTIRQPTVDESKAVGAEVDLTIEPNQLFILDSGDSWGYVIAGVMVVVEDEGEYNDESLLLRAP